MSRLALSTLLTLSLSALYGVERAEAASFEKWRVLSGDAVLVPSGYADEHVPVWMDVTLDGEPDLLLCADNEVHRVFVDEAGALAVTEVTLPPGVDAGRAFAALDVDGDGVEELLGAGLHTNLFRVTAPDELSRVPVPFPVMLSRSVSDMAVGDLNRDGLPDLYVGLGRGGTERLNFSGPPNFILMNRGQGRFERLEQPLRGGLLLGLVLADIDADGRLDVVESVDTSTIAGPSRLLWNRTEPGASVPVFEVSEQQWDVGTHGMGVAVGDLNQDGFLDMYNTSRGQDLLVMGNGSGGFEDQTAARGILHEWASLGLRVQWAPSIVDLDLDGRLDLLVRHGLPATFATTIASAWAADLLYLQGADGNFERTAVPSEEGDGEGKSFAVGDLDGDGRPDVALDGLVSDVHVWRNVTQVPDTTARLTVRFAPTVSAAPPTGTIVTGSCGELVLTRHLTSGGKMGGREAPELHFAWPDCAAQQRVLTVAWPSGALSTHAVEAGVTVAPLEEPRWVIEGGEGTLTLNPEGTGASEACAMNAEDEWVCCESLCEVITSPQGERLVGLDEQPRLGLPSRMTSWLLTTEPALLVPGEAFELTVSQVGGLSPVSGQEVSISVDGGIAPWTTDDSDARTLTAEAIAPTSGVMVATMRAGEETVALWERPTGYAIDPGGPFLDLYPVRAVDTVEEFGSYEVHVHSYPGELQLYDGAEWSLTTLQGDSVPIATNIRESDMRRTSLFVDWQDLDGVDALLLRDHPSAEPVSLPVIQPSTARTLADLVVRAECGLLRTRLAPGYDTVAGVLTLFDEAGHPMLVPSSEVELEVDGAELSDLPRASLGLKDMTFSLRVGATEGEGKIVVRSTEGESWGTCAFKVATRPPQPVDFDASWATLSKTELNRATYDRARLRIGVVNLYGELLGSDVWPAVLLEGGDWDAPLELSAAGTIVGDVAPREDEDTIRLTVTLEGKLIESFEVNVFGATPDEGDSEVPEDEGCGAAGTGSNQVVDVGLIALWAWILWIRQRVVRRECKGAA